MKNKFPLLKSKESGFTLIELLTVIVIIGVLAAIAIPVFTSQRARAQDAQTISDVRNIAVQAETIMSDPTKTYDDVTKANIDFASSKSVSWNISGKASLGGYCIIAKNPAGKKYTTDATALTYDSLAGGVGQSGKACNQTTNPVAPSGSTASGSSNTIVSSSYPAQYANAPETLTASNQTIPVSSVNGGFWQLATDGSKIYAANRSNASYGITTIDLKTGTTTVLNNARTYLAVTYVNNKLYASGTDKNIYQIDLTTGNATNRWTSTSGSEIHGMTTDGTYLYATQYQQSSVIRFPLNADGSFGTVNTAWSGVSAPTALLVKGSALIVGDANGTVQRKDLNTNATSVITTFPSGNGSYSLLGTSSGKIYSGGSAQGSIRSFDGNATNGANTVAATINNADGSVGTSTGITTDGTNLYVITFNANPANAIGLYKF